jgi:ABC-2 type transport system ATP-binding protein
MSKRTRARTPVISVKDLKRYYGTTKAVDGISFDVMQGQIVGFLGPNGAGKTTTLRCLMDFLRPHEGEVTLFGEDAYENAAALKARIGYLSSEKMLYDNWTGREHITFIQGLRRSDGRAEKLVNQLDLDTTKKVKKLSSGNKQKLGLILTLLHSPELLILDEPTSGLDPLLQERIYEILTQAVKNGVTVLMSSHNLAEVERICDRVIIIKEGRIVEEAQLDDLAEKRMYSVRVYLDKPSALDKLRDNGIQMVKKFNDGAAFTVKGDIGPVLQKVSKMDIKDIEIKHANLEEIFMEFYR